VSRPSFTIRDLQRSASLVRAFAFGSVTLLVGARLDADEFDNWRDLARASVAVVTARAESGPLQVIRPESEEERVVMGPLGRTTVFPPPSDCVAGWVAPFRVERVHYQLDLLAENHVVDVFFWGTIPPPFREGERVLAFLEHLNPVGDEAHRRPNLAGTVLRRRPQGDAPDVAFDFMRAFRIVPVPQLSALSGLLRYEDDDDDEIATASAQAEVAADAVLDLTIAGDGTVWLPAKRCRLVRTGRVLLEFGTSVVLTAFAGEHSRFRGWSGACAGNGECVIDARNTHSVTATFAAADN